MYSVFLLPSLSFVRYIYIARPKVYASQVYSKLTVNNLTQTPPASPPVVYPTKTPVPDCTTPTHHFIIITERSTF